MWVECVIVYFVVVGVEWVIDDYCEFWYFCVWYGGYYFCVMLCDVFVFVFVFDYEVCDVL